MIGNINRLRSWVAIFALSVLPLITPLLALAQSESVHSSDNASQQAGNNGKSAIDILNLSIEQLGQTPVVVRSMDMPVTSVTKEASTVGRSAAAVFVITNEMIRQSGATCIPEALRMAPGLEVAKIDSSKWAITCRGFNSRYANKLLVLIDGRSVYTPIYSGVEWDMQDVLLEDVDRIEVVRGPGGTLWGANAVNGVISIITKKSKDTQGLYAAAGGGTYERSQEAMRYGGTMGEDTHYRVYSKYFDRAPGYDPTGLDYDGWQQGRAGFRVDRDLDRSKSTSLTVQGDCYTGETGITSIETYTVPPYFNSLVGKGHLSGENLLARWRHEYDDDSDLTLQTYYDHYCQKLLVLTEDVRTFDVDLQYHFRLGDRHNITCGAGCRDQHEYLPSSDPFTIQFTPPNETITTVSQFVQDEISLIDERLAFTMGVKLEENPYTGLEYQPSMRLLWTPDRQQTFWGAVSRAVRTPSYLEEAFYATSPPSGGLFPRIRGDSSVRSEDLMAYELGYRTQVTDRFSWDAATYYNHYQNLVTMDAGSPYVELSPPPPHMILPFTLTNGSMADTYGVELSSVFNVTDRWRLRGQYTYFHMSMLNNPGTDPHNQVYLTSIWDVRPDVDFECIGRYVDSLDGIDVPSYITMDLRVGWRPRKQLEFAVVGQNLLQPHHLEFNPTVADARTTVTEVPRGVYGTVTWRR